MFLYFIEGHHGGLGWEQADELGIVHVLMINSKPQSSHVTESPSGKPGMMYCPDSRFDLPLSYREGAQEWLEFSPGAWVGYYKSKKPTEESLRKHEQVGWRLVKMNDGEMWRVPVVLAFLSEENIKGELPATVSMEGGRFVRGEVVEEYRKLYERSREFFDAWCSAAKEAIYAGLDDYMVKFCEFEDLAADYLAVNYEIGKPEIALLGLFATAPRRTAHDVVVVACSCAVAIAWWRQKKKEDSAVELNGSSSSHGAKALSSAQ